MASTTEAATSVVLTTKNRVLDTRKQIQEVEAKEYVLLGKIQENLDKIDAVISPARNIQNSIKENLLNVMSLMRRITSSKEATGKIKSSFELILLTVSDRRPQCSEVSIQTTVPEIKRKERSLPSVGTIKRRRGNKGTTVPSQSQRTVGMNVNNQLLALLTPGNSSNKEIDWEVATKRNRRKQRKNEKKSAGRTKTKPDAILIRKNDANATFASVLKLMKDKVDKEQVAENVNKIKQTKTGDVLVQLLRGSNAMHLKEAVTTAIFRKLQPYCSRNK